MPATEQGGQGAVKGGDDNCACNRVPPASIAQARQGSASHERAGEGGQMKKVGIQFLARDTALGLPPPRGGGAGGCGAETLEPSHPATNPCATVY